MIIVNFSTKEYLVGQRRLQASLNGNKCVMYRDYSEIGSPRHKESPYAFKLFAIEKAFEVDDIVLWCDSSLWLVGDITKIERIIKAEGFFASEAGHYCGRWTNQFTKDYFKVTDEEMKQTTGGLIMLSAGLIGLNKAHPQAMEFFRQWKAAEAAGCFRGDYMEHRHDQSSASIIAQRMGLSLQRGGEHMAYIGNGYTQPEPGVVFHLQGI